MCAFFLEFHLNKLELLSFFSLFCFRKRSGPGGKSPRGRNLGIAGENFPWYSKWSLIWLSMVQWMVADLTFHGTVNGRWFDFPWYSEWSLIWLSMNHTCINQSSFPKFQNNYTGKHNFCHQKINTCSLYIFPRWIQICYYNSSGTHSFCVKEFFKMQL